jgi:predicted DNA-binding transcriptional regulator YafY
MERSERFYRIEMLIRRQGSVSFAELMADLQVSRATLKRDLVHLRSRMDAPIVYDRDSNGYQLQGRGRRSSAETSPAGWFGDREVHALLSMLALIGSIDHRSTLGRHLLALQERLESMLGASEAQVRELLKRVRVPTPPEPQGAGHCFELIGRALTERRRMLLQLVAAPDAAAEAVELEVSPQRLVPVQGSWQLDAWCHASQTLRRLALADIAVAEVLESRARDVSLKQVQTELPV